MNSVDIKTEGVVDESDSDQQSTSREHASYLKKSEESKQHAIEVSEEVSVKESSDIGEDGLPFYHPSTDKKMLEDIKQKRKEFRKKLNKDARKVVSQSIHQNVKLIVHRPEFSVENQQEYEHLKTELMPIIREIAKKSELLLKHEEVTDFTKRKYYGAKFQAETAVYQDFRNFARKLPPSELPSLVVGLRIDESASMAAFGRLDAAKRAVVAVYEFCQLLHIPVLIYGDTADVSKFEQMSIYAYTDFDQEEKEDSYRLMNIQARSNNRDGMALRIIADRLAHSTQQTKLLISISDGQPKAMDDYTGSHAIQDMQQTIAQYERKGITFLAAAIGQDQEVIQHIYGAERFLDMTDLKRFPAQLVRMIARYI